MKSGKRKEALQSPRPSRPASPGNDADIKYKALFQQSPFGILIIDAAGNLLEFNEAAHRQLGYSREEFAKLHISDVDPVQSREEIQKSVRAVLDIGKAEFEVKHKTKYGEIRDVRVTTQALALSGQTVLHTIWHDITEGRKAEEKLKLFSQALEEAMDGVHLVDLSGRIFYANRANTAIYGYSVDEMIGRHVSDLNKDKEIAEAVIIPSIKETGRWDGELIAIAKDSRTFPIWLTTALVKNDSGSPIALLGLVRDITERKQSENKLKEMNAHMRALIEAIPDQIVFKDRMGRHLLINKAVEEFTGCSRDDFLGRTAEDLLPPDLAERCRESDQEVLKNLRTVQFEEHYAGRGGERYLDTIKAPILDSLDNVAGLVMISRDVTARKKIEDALRTSREFIKNILDTVDEAFIVVDAEYRIVLANSAYCRQMNMHVRDITGKHCYQISHRQDTPCYEMGEECAVRHSLEYGEPHACMHKHFNKDGGVIYVETKSYPLRDASGNVISAIEVINNVTDKHLLEEQLLRTQKLEAVGLLAGGIAHDFNNLVQGVFGNISMAKMFSDRHGEAYKMLEAAEAALGQARNLTKQLLTFSKGGEPIKKLISLPSVIHNSAKFALSGSNANYLFASDEDLWSVEADEGQITQVMHNIVLNACEAMPEGGTVRIEVRNAFIKERSGSSLPRGKYVQITVADSGTGIPENHISRIFDPYFTTKQRGSGLGLTTSFSIIKKHGGTMDVKSELGAGSIFFIYLPASAETLPPEKVMEKSLIAGKGRILVMDDEDIVRTVAGHMMQSLGYEVGFAENGEQTVEEYSAAMKDNKPFDAVILDLTVRGGMGGRETVRKLLEIDPAAKAIVSSGYSEDPILSNFESYGFKAVLSKPYEIAELSKILHLLVNTAST